MRFQHTRRGFTFIELLFVIVILGIVGGIALEAIRQYYEGIYRTQEYSKRVAEADHILDQLTKYFENAISSSIVNLDMNTEPGGAVTCHGVPGENDPNDYTVAFIGVDSDSMRGIGGNRPGWSEEVTLGVGNVITASDANYTMAGNIITGLGSTLVNSAIYDTDSVDVNACSRFRWSGAGTAGYHMIASSPNSTTLNLTTENNATDGHRKYLLRTGYAFRALNNGDFMMYTSFRPWLGESYSVTVNQNLLGRNVAHFYADYNVSDFAGNAGVSDRGLVWRLKVCMRGLDSNLSTSDTESQAICRERRVHVRY